MIDQYIAAPSRSVRLEVTYARFRATPISALCKRLECRRPSLIEFGFSSSPILELLKIQLGHSEFLPLQLLCRSPDELFGKSACLSRFDQQK
jgi:hypothetical protein